MGSWFGGKSNDEKALANSVNETIPKLGDIADTGAYQGKRSLKSGIKDLSNVGHFFSALLGGDRQQTTAALAPEIRATMNQYDAAKRNLAEYGPRGGGQVAGLSSLAEKEAGDVSSLYSTARSRGAAGLGQVGQALGSLGLGGLGVASSSLSDVLRTLISQQGLEQNVTARKGEALGGLGALVGSLIPL